MVAKGKSGKHRHNWAVGIDRAADHLNPGQMQAFEAELSLNQRHQKKAPTRDTRAYEEMTKVDRMVSLVKLVLSSRCCDLSHQRPEYRH